MSGVAEIQTIPLDRLLPHPHNPRLRMRDDVVTQIAAEITRSGFGPEHALLVRPVPGGYEILSGHHRTEAARRVGLASVPCWVRDMDDDEAFMQLILTNAQGELSPLEEGHHVHYFVERGHVGGRGKEGGLSEYARRLHRNRETLRQRGVAYNVYERCSGSSNFNPDRMGHSTFYEISKAPEDAWVPLVSAWSEKWKLADTARKVSEIQKFKIPEKHRPWLPVDRVTAAYLTDERPTPTAAARLVDEAEKVLAAVAEQGSDGDEAEFRAWLVANTGGESWDHRKISGYHADLIRTWAERRDQADGGRIRIEHCRAADLIQHVELGTVDLIFTDPPYPVEFVGCWTELGELAVKALRPGGLLVAYTGQYVLPEALDRLRDAGLSWFWCYAVAHDGAFFRMNVTHVQCGWKPLLVMRNGDGDPPNWHKDFVTAGSREKGEHEWQQSEAEATYWISELSRPDDLVVDPFVGGGTTAAACQRLGRRFVGCDVDPAAVDAARARVAE